MDQYKVSRLAKKKMNRFNMQWSIQPKKIGLVQVGLFIEETMRVAK